MWAVEASGRGDESINELVAMQTEREPAVVRQTLERIRSIPPHWIAFVQVLLIGLICAVSKHFQPPCTAD